MKRLRKLWLRIFPKYVVFERLYVSYTEANNLIVETEFKPEVERWVIDPEFEDGNRVVGFVYLCRRTRIT